MYVRGWIYGYVNNCWVMKDKKSGVQSWTLASKPWRTENLLTRSIIDSLTQPSNHAYSPLNPTCTYYHIEYDEQVHSHAA